CPHFRARSVSEGASRSQTPVWERTSAKLCFAARQGTEPPVCLGNGVSRRGIPKREFGNEKHKTSPSLTRRALRVSDGAQKKRGVPTATPLLYGNGRRNGRLRGCRSHQVARSGRPCRPRQGCRYVRRANGPDRSGDSGRCKRESQAIRLDSGRA